MKYTFTSEELEKLLLAQADLNVKYTGEAWRDSIPPSSFFAASFTEIAEFLESAPRVGDPCINTKTGEPVVNGWKWWKKKEENDEQNMAIETIDVLHFNLSLLLQMASVEEILKANQSVIDATKDADGSVVELYSRSSDHPIEMVLGGYTRMMMDYQAGEMGNFMLSSYVVLTSMSQACNRGLDDIYEGYFKKNKLNQERIAGGYQEGEYEKLDENGEEDNKKLKV